MTDIAGHEARIHAALARIAAALDCGPAPDAGLAAALAAERAANAELADRLAAQRARHDAAVVALEARVVGLTQQVDAHLIEMQRLRRSNHALREALAGLRAGAESGGAVIDRALAAELAALQAQRSAELAEMDAILAALDPVVRAAEAERGA